MKTFLWKTVPALVLLLLFSSCDISDDDASYHFVTVPVQTVDMPESFTLNETYTIEVTLLVPNGCTSFEGFDVTSEGETIRRVVGIGTERDNVACTEAIEVVNSSFEFLCLYSGTYLFKFWTGENEAGEPQFLEIEVPVTP